MALLAGRPWPGRGLGGPCIWNPDESWEVSLHLTEEGSCFAIPPVHSCAHWLLIYSFIIV